MSRRITHERRRGSIIGTQPGMTEPAERGRRSLHPLIDQLEAIVTDLENNPPPPRPSWQGPDPNRRQRAAQIAATRDPENPVIRKRIIERDRSICWICGHHVPPDQIHLDHVIPLSRGGHHVPENIRVACASCNVSRGDQLSPSAASPRIRVKRSRRRSSGKNARA